MRLNRSTTVLLSQILVPALMLFALPTCAADSTATVSGAVYRAADQSPLVGARLHVGDPRTDRLFSSAPTGRDGSFELAELPASTYRLAVEANGGLYFVQTPVVLAAGSARTLNLAVSPAMAMAEDSDDSDDGDSDDRRKFAFLRHPAGATVVSLGLAAVIGLALDDDDSPKLASPSTPEDQ